MTQPDKSVITDEELLQCLNVINDGLKHTPYVIDTYFLLDAVVLRIYPRGQVNPTAFVALLRNRDGAEGQFDIFLVSHHGLADFDKLKHIQYMTENVPLQVLLMATCIAGEAQQLFALTAAATAAATTH